jgi:uncharacterized membrane protein
MSAPRPLSLPRKATRSLQILASIAIVFGAMTVFSGGRALFGTAQAQAAVGNAVGFVLWFNFLAGFAYVLVGVGLLRAQRWASRGAAALALATALVAAAFAVFVASGGAYEMRTVGALALRLGFWVLVATVALRAPS